MQAEVFVGDDLFGQKIDVLGSEQGSDNEDSMERLPLLNQTVPVDDREQILEALSLGVKVGYQNFFKISEERKLGFLLHN